jgi:hypothetical protein
MSTIKLRAIARIGKTSLELEKARFVAPGQKPRVPTGGKAKEEQLAEAGISTSTANRYEQARLISSSYLVGHKRFALIDRNHTSLEKVVYSHKTVPTKHASCFSSTT